MAPRPGIVMRMIILKEKRLNRSAQLEEIYRRKALTQLRRYIVQRMAIGTF